MEHPTLEHWWAFDAERVRLKTEHERLLEQHSALHGHPVDLLEHVAHRRELQQHSRELRAFREKAANIPALFNLPQKCGRTPRT